HVTLDGMVERFGDIAEGAALLTGTKVEIAEYRPYYEPVKANLALGDVIAAELERLDVTPMRGVLVTASTDLGNISIRVPTDWVRFPVSEKPVPGHSAGSGRRAPRRVRRPPGRRARLRPQPDLDDDRRCVPLRHGEGKRSASRDRARGHAGRGEGRGKDRPARQGRLQGHGGRALL